GGITGSFYDMWVESYEGVPYRVGGMWIAESGPDGLATIPKALPGDFDAANAYLEYAYLDESVAGSFIREEDGINIGVAQGQYGYGDTAFITYDLYDTEGILTDTRSLPFGIFSLWLGEDDPCTYWGKPAGEVAWNAVIGGYGGFGYEEGGYWFADISATWDDYEGYTTELAHGTIIGGLGGRYITDTHMGWITGSFEGLYTEDDYDWENDEGYGTWLGQGVGIYEGVPIDVGGEWKQDFYYNNNGYLEWDGYTDGNDVNGHGLFGFAQRPDNGNYDFLAVGESFNYGYGNGKGSYLWGGYPEYVSTSNGIFIEGLAGGLMKGSADARYGTMTGNLAALYRTESGEVGLMSGPLSGGFVEFVYNDE
ncbi:MAG: hypothetical protein JW765_00160, partial [Deltaproteobacteria bacterium]|nr:hypothetical protein [Candidatus Zymogenaceae bacterium]